MYGLYMDNLWMIFLDMVDLLSGKLIELLNMTENDSWFSCYFMIFQFAMWLFTRGYLLKLAQSFHGGFPMTLTPEGPVRNGDISEYN